MCAVVSVMCNIIANTKSDLSAKVTDVLKQHISTHKLNENQKQNATKKTEFK